MLDLKPLGLFNDSGLADMDRPLQIRKRLEENRRLYEDFDRVTHHFPDEIAERLGISEAFVKKHFGDSSEVKWPDLDFQVIKNEIAAQESVSERLKGANDGRFKRGQFDRKGMGHSDSWILRSPSIGVCPWYVGWICTKHRESSIYLRQGCPSERSLGRSESTVNR
jgi:hypothetical protein